LESFKIFEHANAPLPLSKEMFLLAGLVNARAAVH